MCLIIQKPSNINIEEKLLQQAEKRNDDGWGLMWAVNGRVQSVKGFGIDGLVGAVQNQEFHEAGGFVHLRMATAGEINLVNCHPFKVTNDIYMMHNGVFNISRSVNPKMSDTWHFVKNLLRPTLVSYPQYMLDKNFLEDLEYYVGSNKIAMLRGDGAFSIVNEKNWTKHRGLLLSNTYSCEVDRPAWDGHSYASKYGYYDSANKVWVSTEHGETKPYSETVLALPGSVVESPKAEVVTIPTTSIPLDGSVTTDEYDGDDDSIEDARFNAMDDKEAQDAARSDFERQVKADMAAVGIRDYSDLADDIQTMEDLYALPFDELKSFIEMYPEEVAGIMWEAQYEEQRQLAERYVM